MAGGAESRREGCRHREANRVRALVCGRRPQPLTGEQNKKAFYEAVELAARVQDFIDYDGPDRTAYAERYALGPGRGASPPSTATWRTSSRRARGRSRWRRRTAEPGLLPALALCRKPKEKATFLSLKDEQKALIENIWFDRRFAANLGTIEMLYEKFEEWGRAGAGRTTPASRRSPGTSSTSWTAGAESRPATLRPTVPGSGRTRRCSRASGTRRVSRSWSTWSATSTPSTFGFSGSPRTGKSGRPPEARRMDGHAEPGDRGRRGLRGRQQPDPQGEPRQDALLHPGGVPHILRGQRQGLRRSTTGQSRKKRNIDFEFDAETVGFYQSIGIEEVGAVAPPYQPWDKPIERFFSTVCSKFSKWFESYTGTLTGSKTYAKRQKDVDGMLERELLTMEGVL